MHGDTHIPDGIRTRNLKIRSLAPYPLGHGDLSLLYSIVSDENLKGVPRDTFQIRMSEIREYQKVPRGALFSHHVILISRPNYRVTSLS